MNPSPTDHGRPATMPLNAHGLAPQPHSLTRGPEDGTARDRATTDGTPGSGTLSGTPASGTGHELISTATGMVGAVDPAHTGRW